MNTTEKYYWCIDHEKIGEPLAQGSVELTPHMVNPITRVIEDDKSLNTHLRWWVEYSKYGEAADELPTHYWNLDCGGDTAEEAIDKLYELILEQYGEY